MQSELVGFDTTFPGQLGFERNTLSRDEEGTSSSRCFSSQMIRSVVPFRAPEEIAASFRWIGSKVEDPLATHVVALVAFFTISIRQLLDDVCRQAFLVDSIPVVVMKTGFARNPRTLKLVFQERGSLVRNCHEASGLVWMGKERALSSAGHSGKRPRKFSVCQVVKEISV